MVDTTPPSVTSVAPQARLIRLWAKTEDVAMHFNELILNFRLKALGAVTVGAGLFGSILLTRQNEPAPPVNYVLFAAGMFFLTLVWVAMFAIDAGYYQGLLRGAVREAKRLEEESCGTIRLSVTIDDEVSGGKPRKSGMLASLQPCSFIFYLFPLLAFLLAGGVAIWYAPPRYDGTRRETRIEDTRSAPPTLRGAQEGDRAPRK